MDQCEESGGEELGLRDHMGTTRGKRKVGVRGRPERLHGYHKGYGAM